MAWAKNGTPDTLTGTSSSMTISDLTANIFNQFLRFEIKTVSLSCHSRFNGNANSVYSRRISYSGGTDAPLVSQDSNSDDTGTDTEPEFHVSYVCSISGEEKLMIDFGVEGANVGEGTPPTRSECVAKFVPSPDADITTIEVNTSSSTLAIGSNISALGSDLTPAAGTSATISDGAIFYETDTNKAYVLYNGSWTEL